MHFPRSSSRINKIPRSAFKADTIYTLQKERKRSKGKQEDEISAATVKSTSNQNALRSRLRTCEHKQGGRECSLVLSHQTPIHFAPTLGASL